MNLRKVRISLIIFLIVMIVTIVLVILTSERKKIELHVDKPMKLNFEDPLPKIEDFSHDDIFLVGWLQIQGTNIDFPITTVSTIQHSPNFNFGWRSPMYITGENREVLLGHNVLNVSSEPFINMEKSKNFESLMAFVYYDFAKDNMYIQYTKQGKVELYIIYAVGFYDYGYDNGESFKTKEEVKTYIEKVRATSIFDYSIEVNEEDVLLTVKTCTRYFGLEEKQQFVIDARRVRTNEDILRYKVSKNANFAQLIAN